MPHYNKATELKRIKGFSIPKTATHCALGAKHGLYFKWRGQWNFTALRNFYIRVNDPEQLEVVINSIGDNKIKEC